MPGPGDSAFPIYDGAVVPGAVQGPWFNWKGRRVECDAISWTPPDGRIVIEGLVIPCPKCERPFILTNVKPEMFREDGERRLSLGVVLRCQGFWSQRDAQGQAIVDGSGRPALQRCDWIGVLRSGVAHHPQCSAIHQPGCTAPNGGQCACRMSRMDGNNDCHCGAVSAEHR